MDTLALIYTTSDGGNTWKVATTPKGNAAITSIMMKDALTGYASVYTTDDQFNLWKTTDGGASWSDHTKQYLGTATCIYATSNALVETIWDFTSIHAGGRSLNDGATFAQYFQDMTNVRSNGIDFADDQNGVVVMGPNKSNDLTSRLPCWVTQDGGVNWKQGDELLEAWSVYALKGTSSYYALPEGPAVYKSSSVYMSSDGGMDWVKIYDFVDPASPTFTGHIAGAGSTLYVQTEGEGELGLYRSDDLGYQWNNVGGPANHRDTRFVVTGCNGEVVYAFDTTGGIWKTINGGDGTLTAANTGRYISLASDTLQLASVCSNSAGLIHLTNLSCAEFILDSVRISPDPAHEFSLDTGQGNVSLFSGMSAGLHVSFNTDSNVSRTARIHIYGNYEGIRFDTTVIVIARHSSYIDPLVSLHEDTIHLSGMCSQPGREYLHLSNRNCDSIVIDTINFSPDPRGMFSVDTNQLRYVLSSDSSIGIPIRFLSDSDGRSETALHLRIHTGSYLLDTTIFVVADQTSVPGPILSIDQDSLAIWSRYCESASGSFTLRDANCHDLVIDSISIDPKYPELSIDTVGLTKTLVASSAQITLPVLFNSDSNVTRRTSLHIVAHSLNRIIDTTISIEARHTQAPSPYISDPIGALAGVVAQIPVFIYPTTDSFAFRRCTFHLSYDGDILTPAVPAYDIKGTLSALGSVVIGPPEPAGIQCTIDIPAGISQKRDLSLPLIVMRMTASVAKNSATSIQMDSFSITNTKVESACSFPNAMFTLTPACGDSTLADFMRNGKLPEISSIRPNPGSYGEFEAVIDVPESMSVTIDLVDAIGRTVTEICSAKLFQPGSNPISFTVPSVPSGSYSLRMRAAGGWMRQRTLVIIR